MHRLVFQWFHRWSRSLYHKRWLHQMVPRQLFHNMQIDHTLFFFIFSTITLNFPRAVPVTKSAGGRSFERFSSKSETFTIGSTPWKKQVHSRKIKDFSDKKNFKAFTIWRMSLSRFGDWLANIRMGSLSMDPRAWDMVFRRVLILSQLFTTSWGHPKTLKQSV